MHRAVAAPSLPAPFETFNVLADLPHGKYSNARAKQLIGWRPAHNLAPLWATRR